MGGISIWQLLIIALIIILLFGTKKLGSLGSDLGKLVKGFKEEVGEQEKNKDASFDKVEQKANTSTEQKAKEKEQA